MLWEISLSHISSFLVGKPLSVFFFIPLIPIFLLPVLSPEPELTPQLAAIRDGNGGSLAQCHLTSWRCPRKQRQQDPSLTPQPHYPQPQSQFAEPTRQVPEDSWNLAVLLSFTARSGDTSSSR